MVKEIVISILLAMLILPVFMILYSFFNTATEQLEYETGLHRDQARALLLSGIAAVFLISLTVQFLLD